MWSKLPASEPLISNGWGTVGLFSLFGTVSPNLEGHWALEQGASSESSRIEMPAHVGPSIGKSLGSGALSVFQSGPSAGGGLLLAQKTLCNFYNNSIKQTRKSRLFSLIDWLVSLWNLPALPPLHTLCWGYRFTVLYPAFPWGLGSELSSHFLHSKLSTRRAVSPSLPDARSNQLYFHWRRLHVTLP